MMLSLSPDYQASLWRKGGAGNHRFQLSVLFGKILYEYDRYNKKAERASRIDELLSTSASELNLDTSKKLYEEISRTIFEEDVPIIVICYPDNVDVAYDYVKNWRLTALDYLERTRTWYPGQRSSLGGIDSWEPTRPYHRVGSRYPSTAGLAT